MLPRKLSKILTGGAVVLTALTAATACSSSHTNSGSGDSSTLVIEDNPVSPFTRDFNPFDTNDTAYLVQSTGLIYEPLLQFNVMKPGTVYPWLAKSYAFSNNGATVTFNLQPNAKWSDGQPFTSQDAAFTFNLLKQNKAINTNGVTPTDIKTPDAHTLVLDFATPQYANLYYIGSVYMVPEHIWQTVSNPSTWEDTDPIGTGPYVLDTFNSQGFTLGRNGGYWQGQPKIATVRFPSYVSNTSASLALAQSQIDWGGNDIANIEKTFVAADRTHNKYWFAPVNVVTLQLNTTKAPLNDVAVRRAISAGIDRNALSKIGETGYEPPATSSGGLLLGGVDDKYLDPSLSNDLVQNTGKVSSILSADGYKQVNGKWTKNGATIKFNLEDPSSYSDYYENINLISQQLNQEGFETTVNGTTPDTWTSDYNSGNFDATIHWGNVGPTPYFQYDNWLDSNLSAAVGTAATGDQSRFNDPDAQAALAEYANTNDPSTQTDALNKLQQIVSQQAPVIPLLYGAAWDEYSTKKFTGWPTESDPYEDPTPNSPFLEYTVLHLTPVS
ncbi:MAG TPA: ABC transporter substrate-binding protein [Pseudonocardiaceae bacterium]|nr:ABC transporter substrate-binding protein [Pseudonocardiaceae bacterium]